MTRPLHFLHLTTFYPPYHFGGDAVFVHRLAHALADLGHRVDVIHCVDAYHALHPGAPPAHFQAHPGVSVHALRSGLGWLSPLLTQQTGLGLLKSRAINRVLAARHYDVVHFHNISLLGAGVLTFDFGPAIKLYTAHEYWLVCPTHVLWKFGRERCEQPRCIACMLHARRPPQTWRYTSMLERCAAHVDQFIAPSRFAAAAHRERGFQRPFETLGTFVDDVPHADPKARALVPERPYFLFVGRLEKLKGLHTVLGVMDHFPDTGLLVAGEGSECERLCRQAATNTRIEFLGVQPPEVLDTLYAQCVACLVPSLAFESCPLVALEALARKAPVIAHDGGGIGELIRESGGGIAYSDQQGLVAAMQLLLQSPEHCRELGERGYRALRARWSRRAHLARYFRIIEAAAIRKLGHVPWRGEPANTHAARQQHTTGASDE